MGDGRDGAGGRGETAGREMTRWSEERAEGDRGRFGVFTKARETRRTTGEQGLLYASPAILSSKKKKRSLLAAPLAHVSLRSLSLQRVVDPLFPFLGVPYMQGVGVPPDRFSMLCSYSRALDSDTEMR